MSRRLMIAVAAGVVAALVPVPPAAAGAPVITVLGILPGHTDSSVSGLTDTGTVIGQSFDGLWWNPKTARAVKWSRTGAVTALPTPPRDPNPHSRAVDVNEAGTATGYTYGGPDYHGLRWNADGSYTELRPLPGDNSSRPVAISADGTVIGESFGPYRSYRAVRWAPDATVALLPVPPGQTDSRPEFIDDHNTIVGGSYSWEQRSYTLRWDPDGTYSDISGLISGPLAMNNAGTITGFHAGRGYTETVRVHADGSRDELGWLAAPVALNAAGTAVGGYEGDEEYGHAVRWAADGTVTSLPELPSDTDSWANAVNDADIAVGTSSFSLDEHSVESHAVFWDAAGKVTALPLLPGGKAGNASHINASGTIAGGANTTSGHLRAVLWRR
ncbi:hypothetical protein AB0I60_01660 [Actinosynnema sp. NPDC050436]|uniref:hypothetical protein n=1 Tax=Actinosynnema sp. NPDC050436 TaxID=3155659 RepID=UPI0033D7218E